ncbi:carbamoylphosphate synthase large subunit [Bacillus sp. JCM 19046]|nr:carbamoylphosphate synthase large subunit [Bacillus sp. JCM 19045]GAF18167.1 carbamoylphosphate synthase large subunit [Bacillus sp. JCM 19046]
MNRSETVASQPFIPVILGGNLGVYSIARSFHEAYNVKSIVISSNVSGPISHAPILETIERPNYTDEKELLNLVSEIETTYANIPKFLIATDDGNVDRIIAIREFLSSDEWMVPYTTRENIDILTNKSKFYELCEELGLDYPKQHTIPANETEVAEIPFTYPVVIKPARSIYFSPLSFAGKNKVYFAQNEEELKSYVQKMRNGGYQEEIIMQEFVPGDDTSMHILTCYTAQDGETKLASFGQTLLEDHTPSAIGNPVVIRTMNNEEVGKQAKKLIEHMNFVGFSNFDLKYDERDGKYKFFELNARLGRSNYYVTAGGNNTAEFYVKDFLYNERIEPVTGQEEVLFSVVPKNLLLKYVEDPKLKEIVKEFYRNKQVKSPLDYSGAGKNLKRRFYENAAKINYYRKFSKFPPINK